MVLSQRQEVLSDLCESYAYQLIGECMRVFKNEIKKDNLAYLFEHSGFVVVYLLRYRIYKPDFLEPDSVLAIQAKRQFDVAIQKLTQQLSRLKKEVNYTEDQLKSHRFTRLKAAFQQLIDYIDKRGEGDILLAIDD